MADPTPKQKLLAKMSEMEAAEFRLRADVHPGGKQSFAEGLTLQKIHSAVAAQKETDAKKNPQSMFCPFCESVEGEECTQGGVRWSGWFHTLRWQAAIRKGPDD